MRLDKKGTLKDAFQAIIDPVIQDAYGVKRVPMAGDDEHNSGSSIDDGILVESAQSRRY